MPQLEITRRYQTDILRCSISCMKMAVDYLLKKHSLPVRISESKLADHSDYHSNMGTSLETSIDLLNPYLSEYGIMSRLASGREISHETLCQLIDNHTLPTITVDFKRWRPVIDQGVNDIQDDDFGYHNVVVYGYEREKPQDKVMIFDPFHYFYKDVKSVNGVEVKIDMLYDVWAASNETFWFEVSGNVKAVRKKYIRTPDRVIPEKGTYKKLTEF